MSNPEPDSRVGSRFGPYQLTRLLGGGEAGEVYAAEDTRTGRMMALKLIDGQFSDDVVFGARVQHPHVVPVDDHGEFDGVDYLAMQLIDGVDLAALLARSGPLSPPRAVAIVHQIAAALDAAHAEGVLHGDVKGENILVTGDDFAYLVDSGIGRAADDPEPDVRALGRVLTDCLTGTAPDRPAVPRPSRVRPGQVPAALDAVVARALAKTPEDRYRSAGDLATAAAEALRQPERHQVARILQRGATAAGPPVRPAPPARVRVVSTAPTLPSQVARARWHTPLVLRLRQKHKPILIGGAVLVAVAAVVAVGYLFTRPAHISSAAAPRQTVLPFTDLSYRLSPGGVAVDAGGDVYVTSQGVSGRLVRLSNGAMTETVLPFGDLYQPQGVVVDIGGNVYFSDLNNRVVKSEADTDTQSVLPFTGLYRPGGLAVDAAGNVYVADRGNNQVVKLEVASNTQSVLPFGGLHNPSGVAVDDSGGVYVTDTDNNRVVKLAGETGDQTVLPFTGIAMPWGIAVGSDGSVYVTEYRSNKVAKLAAGSAIPAVLPFTGLNTPSGVAVDRSGNVYVADRGNDRVLKLPG
ncbi:MAG TPA: serine/threonine-protein kinase PknD [Mycobacterium sp.]|nr:serine/threonine-protein kinase PknD [Mycobacterium sp.]